MKGLVLAALAGTFLATGCSQNVDTRHKIEVSGSAEAEATPDIIYVGVSLKEFFSDNISKKKVSINELETQLLNAVLKAGIPKENFTINNTSSYNYAYERKKNPTFLASKQYRIKVSDLNKFNQIISGVDAKAVEYTNIEGYDYSKIEILKQELKIKALKAAKDKASYLAEAVGDEVGDALEINEINNGQDAHMNRTMNAGMGAVVEQAAASMPEIDFKKVKLNYQIRAVFELVN